MALLNKTAQGISEVVPQQLVNKLRQLADKYEVAAFTKEDPSQFLRWYKKNETTESTEAYFKTSVPSALPQNVVDTELASFIAAMLAFGNRRQFIPKIKQILESADSQSGSISGWIKSSAYKTGFATGTQKFYRFYSYEDMHVFFEELTGILQKAPSLGEYFHLEYERAVCDALKNGSCNLLYADVISAAFPKSKIVPKGKNSANKRIHMLLRWMVRKNSPVDLGIWTWAEPAKLIIPLDVHVMQQAAELGLIPKNATASRKTALQLTSAMQQVFPGDPSRADYALFGLGVDEENKK